MKNYVIFTDSCCDIKPEMLEKWGVVCEDMTFSFEGEDKVYTNRDMTCDTFYNRMRDGGIAKTAAINAAAFTDAFTPILEAGKDILYVAFSSALSTTVNSAYMAIEDLKETYPEREIVVVDTLAASAGGGLMVYMAVAKKREGATLQENAAYIRSLLPGLCVWFTVNDLEYLRRGGRVSSMAALAGGLLGIKPVLKMDDEGHLIKESTVRGRKKSLETLADRYTKLSNEEKNTPVFISHAQCEDDARALADMLMQRHGVEATLITDIGPVIGSHTGPGAVALFFLGKHR